MIKRIFSLVALIGAIIVPLSASAASYLIERGDTLTSIAREFGVSVRDIAIQNDIKDVNKIYAGATLEINSANTDEGADGDVLGGPGGAYTPVTGYQSRITTYISAAATTVPVASTKDKAGNQIVLADISSSSTAKVYLSLATGTSKEEIIACTGLTSASWTGCSRGLSFQGGSMTASTTIAYAHNAGESVIITDVGQFFNEFVSVSGNQTIFDRKTFYAFPIVTSTTALPTLGSELASKYYVDSVGAGGFTSLNASTTRGLSVDGSAPERVGINASTTKGLAFDNNGTSNWPLYIAASSTGGINFHTDGTIQVDGSDNFAFSGSNVFSGNNVFSGAVTSTGSLRAQTPTIANDVAIKSYVDSQGKYGDGSDGAFSQSSGTTTLNDASKNIYQYSSFALTGTAALAIGSNNQNKPVYIFVNGDLTVTSSAGAAVNANGMGGAGGSSSAGGSGNAGTSASIFFSSITGGAGTRGTREAGTSKGGSAGGGGGGLNANGSNGTVGTFGVGGAGVFYSASASTKRLLIGALGSGGGGGTASSGGGGADSGTGGAGGAGGGCIIFIVSGNINITSQFSAAGANGSDGTGVGSAAAGGGGGGGGFVGIFHAGTVTANTATFVVTGGSGGAGLNNGTVGGTGGDGATGASLVRAIKAAEL